MWIYYYVMSGPGHQSETDGFEYFPKDVYEGDMETVNEVMEDRIDRWFQHTNFSAKWWEVETPTPEYTDAEIKDTKNKIKNLRKYLKMLEGTSCLNPMKNYGIDRVMEKNMKGKVRSDLLEKLHKAGFICTISDIRFWEEGQRCPVEPQRSKILRVIRRGKKYPSYSKK